MPDWPYEGRFCEACLNTVSETDTWGNNSCETMFFSKVKMALFILPQSLNKTGNPTSERNNLEIDGRLDSGHCPPATIVGKHVY